jgi:hypothetical protein
MAGVAVFPALYWPVKVLHGLPPYLEEHNDLFSCRYTFYLFNQDTKINLELNIFTKRLTVYSLFIKM